jgi:hypothetical protein
VTRTHMVPCRERRISAEGLPNLSVLCTHGGEVVLLRRAWLILLLLLGLSLQAAASTRYLPVEAGIAQARLRNGYLRRSVRRPRPLPFTPQVSGEWKPDGSPAISTSPLGFYGGGRLIYGWRGYRAGVGLRLDLADESFWAFDVSASGWWGGRPAQTVRVGLTRRF